MSIAESGARVRTAAELAILDIVRTPMNREAKVIKIADGRVHLEYLQPEVKAPHAQYVSLPAHYLVFVRHAAPHGVPRSFFNEAKR